MIGSFGRKTPAFLKGKLLILLARPVGFEPTTFASGGLKPTRQRAVIRQTISQYRPFYTNTNKEHKGKFVQMNQRALPFLFPAREGAGWAAGQKYSGRNPRKLKRGQHLSFPVTGRGCCRLANGCRQDGDTISPASPKEQVSAAVWANPSGKQCQREGVLIKASYEALVINGYLPAPLIFERRK